MSTNLLHVHSVWRQDELCRINETTAGPERKAALCALLDTKLCWHWFLLKSHADYSVNIEHSVVSLLLHPVDVMSLCAQTFLPNILQN